MMKNKGAVLLVAILCFAASVSAAIDDHRVTSLPDYGGDFKSKNYAGYITLPTTGVFGGRKIFYWFIESERNPRKDPLVIWLNGGPGCSSLLGLFTEIGPYTIRHTGKFFNNSQTWATRANLLFIESPPGVGFSVDTVGNTNWNDELTAQMNYKFLSSWMTQYPEYSSHPLYLTGESYAGHYVPQFANKILHGDGSFLDANLKANMRGFMVGNPCTGTALGDGLDWCFTTVDPTLDEYFVSHAFQSYDPAIPAEEAIYDPYDVLERYCHWVLENEVVRWNHAALRRRREQMGAKRFLVSDTAAAQAEKTATSSSRASSSSSSSSSSRTFQEQGGYVPKPPVGPPPTYGPCNANYLQLWLNRPDVKKAMHADADIEWEMCSNTLIYPTPPTISGVMDLYSDFMLNTNWSLMIYSGDADTVVNFIQSEKIVISMNRPVLSNFTPWYYQDPYNSSWIQLGGFYVNYDRISWASVKGAGHMVPTYVPNAALQLLDSFLATGRPGKAPPLDPYFPGKPNAGGKTQMTAKEWELFFGGIVIGGVVALLGTMIHRFTSGGGGSSGKARHASSEAGHTDFLDREYGQSLNPIK